MDEDMNYISLGFIFQQSVPDVLYESENEPSQTGRSNMFERDADRFSEYSFTSGIVFDRVVEWKVPGANIVWDRQLKQIKYDIRCPIEVEGVVVIESLIVILLFPVFDSII